MIEHLTPEQEALIPSFVQKWLAIGLSTEPADRPRAENAIRWMYERGGLPAPLIIWTGSPLGNVRQFLAQVGVPVGDQIKAQVGPQVGDLVWDQIKAQVGPQVGPQVGDLVWDRVVPLVRSQFRSRVVAQVVPLVMAQVRDLVEAQIESLVEAQVGDLLRSLVEALARSGHDVYFLGFYNFFGEVCGFTEETKALYGLSELAQSAGWILCFEKTCFVSERYSTLKRDAEHRPHCEDGPAVKYPDGFSVYAWRGMRVPEDIIMQPVTRDRILNEGNTERRRVLIERVGFGQFAEIMQPRLLDTDIDEAGNTRTLLRIDVHNRHYFGVRYECPSTGRQYLTPVPPHMTSCAQAVAWIDGVDAESILLKRT